MNSKHLDIISFARQTDPAGRRLISQRSVLNKFKNQYDLYKIKTLELLAVEKPADITALLKISIRELEEVINYPTYNTFPVAKKKGGNRIISAPEGLLKYTQKRLNRFLQSYYYCIKPPEVHGFNINPMPRKEKHCNIVENARPHAGKRHLLNMDIKDFFPSISARRVKELFLSEYFQYNDKIATALALLLTYKRKLPTGAPTSPVISNFISLELDSALGGFCRSKSISYTRYADDLSFSADIPFKKDIIQEIKSIIESHHFRVNHQKTRLSGANRKQTVTGLVVNEKVNVDRRYIRKTRAMLDDSHKNGLAMAAFSHFGIPEVLDENELIFRFKLVLNGRIDFIGQVRGKEDAGYLKLKEKAMEMGWG